jgi:hypothetical protein
MRLLQRKARVNVAPLRESDVYTRCYGERGGDILAVTKFEPPPPPPRVTGEKLREALERRIDGRRS